MTCVLQTANSGVQVHLRRPLDPTLGGRVLHPNIDRTPSFPGASLRLAVSEIDPIRPLRHINFDRLREIRVGLIEDLDIMTVEHEWHIERGEFGMAGSAQRLIRWLNITLSEIDAMLKELVA